MDGTCMVILKKLNSPYGFPNKFELRNIAKVTPSDIDKALCFLLKNEYITDDGREPTPDKPIEYKITQKGKNFLHHSFRENIFKIAPIAISLVALIISIIALYNS